MSHFLEFFAADESVAILEAAVESSAGSQRQPALIALAWQMRHRDTQRALALADEAQTGLAEASATLAEGDDDTQSAHNHLHARLMLVRGEAKLLFGALDAAAVLASQALQDFAARADALGCADAHWLQYSIALGQGESARAVLFVG